MSLENTEYELLTQIKVAWGLLSVHRYNKVNPKCVSINEGKIVRDNVGDNVS